MTTLIARAAAFGDLQLAAGHTSVLRQVDAHLRRGQSFGVSAGADVAARICWLNLQGQHLPDLICLQELPRTTFIVLMHGSPV